MNIGEVISAFLDNEPFDPEELRLALADPAGRDLLIDLVALRELVTVDDEATGTAAPPRRWSPASRWLAAAAVVVVSLGAGVAIGHRVGRSESEKIVPPPATRVIDLKPGVEWHETGGGH